MLRIKPITEAEFTAQVLQYARLRGWLTAHFRPGMTQAGNWVTAVQGDGKGFPDLVLARECLVVAELKVGRNQLTAEQVVWLERMKRAGVAAYVWRPENWPEIEERLR